MFVIVDKYQHFKCFIRKTTSIRLEHSSNVEIPLLIISKLLIFLQTGGYNRLQASIALCNF